MFYNKFNFNFKAKILKMNLSLSGIILILLLIHVHSTTYPVYASSCDSESPTRVCPQEGNITEYLLGLKKGGSDILSTSDYDSDFFLCEEYTFDCGYVTYENQTVSIANGIQLDMNTTQVDNILPVNTTLATNIKHYLNLSASDAKCGMKIFPLILTDSESDLFFTNYMNILVNQIKTKYSAQKKNGTLAWSDINVNIKTALCEVIKQNNSLLYSGFWDDFKYNNFTEMSDYLKEQYLTTNQLYFLRSAYLIDSVTQRCNKYQSVNFLVDQSGSITAPNFQFALDFLVQYINNTYDDPKLMSAHFFDSTFEPYLQYGHTKQQLISAIQSKSYRAQGTMTGSAINQTIAKILAGNFDSGLNKIMIVITDGYSYDEVGPASNYARSKGITMLAVGIGSGVNDTQLLQIAQTPSNVITVTNYANLGKLVSFIENFFCKQIIDVRINQTIVGNVVRVPSSPSYFRVQQSLNNETYMLKLSYQVNPDQTNQSLFTSQYDPFPDQFSEFIISESYRPSLLQKVYFVSPAAPIDVRVKQNFYKSENISNSFVSVGGTNMKFNISLNPCTTPTCKVEKAGFQAIGSMKDVSPSDGKDYNIYGIIAGSVAALLCLSLMGAAALKKCSGGDDETELMNKAGDKKFQPELTEQDINDQIRSENDNKSNKHHEQHSQDNEMNSQKSSQSKQKKPLKGKK